MMHYEKWMMRWRRPTDQPTLKRKKASDKAPNGYPKYPQFNFCSKDDLDDY